MEGLKGKTVLLVTHQVDFLPAFDYILVSTPLFTSMIIKFNLKHTPITFKSHSYVDQLLITFIYS